MRQTYFGEFCHFWATFMVDLWKRYASKLRRITLLQFGLITFRFADGGSLKPLIFMISGILNVSFLPQTNYVYLWLPYKIQENLNSVWKIVLQMWESQTLKIWKWVFSYLEFGNLGFWICAILKTYYIFKLSDLGTLEFRNFQT